MDSNIITYLACICFLFIFGRIFIVPIKKVLKLVLNSVLGGLLIYIINLIGTNWGFHIGLNFFTSILIRNFRYSWSNLYCYYKIVNRLKKIP
ncbi:MAG: pro-sigmaK processing inhibitor BofA family protein [Clostridia bacterium]|nr:pro-sigmaK processing inhibitor BofA family protein [Clostridia bacterium]